jgi:molybdate transport repressor ModE-like protein
MAVRPALDLDLLRTLVLIGEEGSFTRAAGRVGRTQSTVSLQVQRLEALIGQPLVSRGRGGTVELTSQGRLLIERSRALLELNDEIFATLRVAGTHGSVRLGVPEAYAHLFAPQVLARFAATNPTTTIELSHAPSCQLVPQLKAGNLDLLLCVGGHEPRQWPVFELWRGPLKWITSERHSIHLEDPLPLALSPGDCPWLPPWLDGCLWRGAALRALERAGRRHKIVSTATTVEGQQAAALAGLAVVILPEATLVPGLRTVRSDEGLPDLPETTILLVKAQEPRQPETDALAKVIMDTFEAIRAAAQGESVGKPEPS